MPDTTALADYIRYQLSSLNAKNRHHDFEEMCYQFARLAISPNFLPATGPVSSGGDQGRDSETFQSTMHFAPPVGSAWGFADGRKAVIACSLEKRFKLKIESDIKKICEEGKPDFIYFFSNQDIPVATRHKLQAWSIQAFGVELEIFDALAISDQLTRFELFWVAQNYLNIPSEMYPRTQNDENEKYNELYNKWIMEKRIPCTFSDFFEIKSGVRKATFEDKNKIDLVEWINVLNSFHASSSSIILRRCKYEICVAALRGLGNLDRQTALVESYFEDISSLELEQIEDASVLLSYCSGALLQHHFNYSPRKIHDWTVALIARIEELLKQTTNLNQKCDLLSHRSFAAALPFQKTDQPFVDWNDPFKWWNRLLSEVKNAPLFPLERFSDLITVLVPAIGDEPGYVRLTEKLDELLSSRSQGFIAAEKCRDRAMAFIEQSRPIRAIHELHNAKIKWFSKETLQGTILSMLMLSRLYSDIKLVWAAKYYALAAAYLIQKDNDDKLMPYFPKALIQLFNTCYQGGEWISCINLLPLVIAAHYQFHSDPEDYSKHQDFQSVIVHSMIIYQSNKKLGNNEIDSYFFKALERWPLPDDLNDLILANDMSSEMWINSAEPDQLWKKIDEELDGVPFSDIGKTRTFSWRALGIHWLINCNSAPATVSAVESFVSCLQIVTVDLADKDLNLLPTTVRIEASCFASAEFNLKEVRGNDGSNWKLDIPSNSSSNDLDSWALVFATLILTSCSLLSNEQCKFVFEESFKKGLRSKTFVVRPYHELLNEFTQSELELAKDGLPRPAAPASVCMHESASLAWKSGPGPGYTEESSKEQISNRYARSIGIVRHSLEHLNNQTEFREFVASLRKQGYFDWHILLMIANVALNKRAPVRSDYTPGDPEDRKAIIAAFECAEAKEDPPLTIQDLLSMPIEMHLNMQLSTLCSTWRLIFKSQTPDFDALRKVLVERYGYMTDDVPHEPLFVEPQ